MEFITVGTLNDMNPRPDATEILQSAGGGGAGRGGYSYPLIAELAVGSGRVIGVAFDLNDFAGMRDRDLFVPARPAEPPAAAPVETKPAPLPAVETKPAAPEVKPVETKPAAPEPKPAEPAPAVAPTVRVGDLVTMGPGVVPPKMTRRGTFRYPPMAQRMRKEAQITIKVLIDETGRAVDAQNSSEKVGFGMDEAAVAYARNCQFEPAKKAGVKVKVWYEIKVQFKL